MPPSLYINLTGIHILSLGGWRKLNYISVFRSLTTHVQTHKAIFHAYSTLCLFSFSPIALRRRHFFILWTRMEQKKKNSISSYHLLSHSSCTWSSRAKKERVLVTTPHPMHCLWPEARTPPMTKYRPNSDVQPRWAMWNPHKAGLHQEVGLSRSNFYYIFFTVNKAY